MLNTRQELIYRLTSFSFLIFSFSLFLASLSLSSCVSPKVCPLSRLSFSFRISSALSTCACDVTVSMRRKVERVREEKEEEEEGENDVFDDKIRERNVVIIVISFHDKYSIISLFHFKLSF
jgi:hypothetical protein